MASLHRFKSPRRAKGVCRHGHYSDCSLCDWNPRLPYEERTWTNPSPPRRVSPVTAKIEADRISFSPPQVDDDDLVFDDDESCDGSLYTGMRPCPQGHMYKEEGRCPICKAEGILSRCVSGHEYEDGPLGCDKCGEELKCKKSPFSMATIHFPVVAIRRHAGMVSFTSRRRKRTNSDESTPPPSMWDFELVKCVNGHICLKSKMHCGICKSKFQEDAPFPYDNEGEEKDVGKYFGMVVYNSKYNIPVAIAKPEVGVAEELGLVPVHNSEYNIPISIPEPEAVILEEVVPALVPVAATEPEPEPENAPKRATKGRGRRIEYKK